MSTLKQDLVLFADTSIIPRGSKVCGTITHTQGTSPAWLVESLVENGLFGTCSINADGKASRSLRGDVVLISLVHDEGFYDLKRNSIALGETPQFHFVDLFTDLFGKVGDVEHLNKTFDQLASQIDQYTSEHKTVLVEGLEFLIGATQLTASHILNQLTKLQRVSQAIFVILAADKELVQLKVNDSSLIEFRMNELLTRLIHRSHLAISLRPLETGKAKDVTGTLTISRGALPFEGSTEVMEKEYLFLTSKDQQTKLFLR